MKRHTIGRRSILQGIGGSLLGLPFLRSIPSRAAETPAPKRLVIFFTGNEPGNREMWDPGAEGPLTTLKPVMAPLEGIKHKLTMLGGLALLTKYDDPHKGGHVGMGHVLTGVPVAAYGQAEQDYWGGGISVDQLIAKRLGVKAMTLAVRPGGANGPGHLSYYGAEQPASQSTDPISTFEDYFAGLGGDQAEQEAKRARRQRVLDFAAKDITAVRQKISAADRAKLDQHLEAIDSIAKDLDSGAGLSCEATKPGKADWTSNAALPVAARKQMDLMVQALACDVTRVASLQIGTTGGGNTPTWPDEGLNIKMAEHDLCHAFNDNPGDATIKKNRHDLEKFYFRLYADLLNKLDAVEDPEGGTLLDNSLVVYAKILGYRHNAKQMLFMIGGSGGGAIQTGRYRKYDDRSHCDLLTALCQAMGLDDVTSFGMAKHNGGPLAL